MTKFWRRRVEQEIERVEHKIIEVVSVRRRFKEKWAKGKFRELFTTYQTFPLTASQVEAATSHARETMVIAGAGSGKTSLLLGRAKYLIDSSRVSSEEILILAFNNKAAKELSERAEALGLDIKASTFHKFGKDLLENHGEKAHLAFTNDHEVTEFIEDFIRSVDPNSDYATNAVKYFVGQLVPTKAIDSYSTLNDYKSYVGSMPKTLQGEKVKSHGEWLIANFLWSMSVPYKYEELYEGRSGEKQGHKPDFHIVGTNIFIEYFGVDKDGRTLPGIDSDKYNQSSDWKRRVHKQNGTNLIELTYQDLRDKQITGKLYSALQSHGIETNRKTNSEILRQANEMGYQARIIKTVQVFLQHTRAQRPTESDLRSAAQTDRDKMFIDLFLPIHDAYVNHLQKLNRPDFSDLIHAGADLITSGEVQLPFTHLMIDEFQDISHDRYRLIDAIRNAKPKTEITFVGDDWQAIYAFAGSDVSILRNLSKPKIGRKKVDLGDTFRMPQSLATIATNFIIENPLQLRKNIVSKFDLPKPVVFHWDTEADQIQSNLERVMDRIGADSDNPEMELQILARYRDHLPRLKFVEEHWSGPITLETIHKVKGLESDYVIIVDLQQDFRGFPSTIEDDPVLGMVLKSLEEFPHAEERRLFYVALTRARKQCHIVSPSNAPSAFATEMLDNQVGFHHGNPKASHCPKCQTGFLTQKAGHEGFSCSNWPLCVLRTPGCPNCSKAMRLIQINPTKFRCVDHESVELPKCPKCSYGVLVKRNGKFGEFQSCHMWPDTQCPGK